MRIDKYLWSVRLFKTRSIATEECRKGKILINDVVFKASREVKINDVFQVKKTPLVYTYKVKGIPKSRVGAKLVDDYLLNMTPQEELDKLENMKVGVQSVRDRGAGRPTKKDRRIIDDFFGE